MAVPELSVCAPGSVTVTTLSMVKASVLVPVKPSESVAWTVAEYDPAVVGVPVTTPAGDRVRPGGSEPETTDQPEGGWWPRRRPPRWWPRASAG